MFTYIVTSLLIIHLTMTNFTFICYHLIRLYSYLQIKLTTNKTPKIKNVDKDTLDCLVGDTILTGDSDEDNLEVINQCDFAVLISKGANMVCFYPPLDEYNPEYEMSMLQFISVKIEIDSVEYDIKMRTSHYTFYIVDNELNVEWVRYYFQKFLKISLPVDVKYQMTIVDENVQFIMLNENESMVLEQNSYRLYLEDQEEEEEEEEDQSPEVEEPNDPDEISLEKMIEIEEEIKAEQKQQQDEGDLDVDKLISEFEQMSVEEEVPNMGDVAENEVTENETLLTENEVIENEDTSNKMTQNEEKTQGWFNLF